MSTSTEPDIAERLHWATADPSICSYWHKSYDPTLQGSKGKIGNFFGYYI